MVFVENRPILGGFLFEFVRTDKRGRPFSLKFTGVFFLNFCQIIYMIKLQNLFCRKTKSLAASV